MRIKLVAIGLFCLFLQSLPVQAAGPLVGTSLNGTPLADQFPGADICAQINAAALSLGSAGGIVDATHFTGTLACGSGQNAVDPSAGVTAPVVVEIGNVTIQVYAGWNITNPRFKLHGSGPGHSGIQYVGTTWTSPESWPRWARPDCPSGNWP